MDKLPARRSDKTKNPDLTKPKTPSPRRFLLKPKPKNAEPLSIARHRPASWHLATTAGAANSISVLDALQAATSSGLASTNGNPKLVENNIGARPLQPEKRYAEATTASMPPGLRATDAGTNTGAAGVVDADTPTNDGSVAPENSLRMNMSFATPQGKTNTSNAGLLQGSAQQSQTPSMSQFKAAPKFRFGSSQARSRSGARAVGDRVEAGDATPRPTQRWRAAQTPLRQSLRRELTEEEIVEVEGEGEMLMDDVRASIEAEDGGGGDERTERSYVQLDFATPAPKRRKVGLDPVESFDSSQGQYDETAPFHNHEDFLHRGGQNGATTNGVLSGNENHDEEMLYDDNHEKEQEPLLFAHLPQTSQSLQPPHQPATSAPTYSQRPRFILPSSTRPSTTIQTPQPVETFAPTPYFILSTPASPHTPADGEPQFIKPPKFKPIEEPEPSEPLRAEFSPRKRGQKFVIGGLANEVRSWLVDLECQTSAPSVSKREEEGWMVKMVVEEVAGGRGVGWTLARGVGDGEGDGLRVVLGGEGMAQGIERARGVERGGVVGIRKPVWEVDIGDVRWGVGASWKAWAM